MGIAFTGCVHRGGACARAGIIPDGAGGKDQPQVEKLTKEQAAKKQALDDELRTRLSTTQSDR